MAEQVTDSKEILAELLSLARSECGLSEDRTIEVLEEASERAEALALLFG